jgi:transcriptional regulator with XRE-family HTH domain
MTAPLAASLFRQCRERLTLTETTLARQTGVSPSTIRALERGTNHLELRVRFLMRLTDVLGIQPAQLFEAPGEAPAQPATTDDAKLEALLHQHGTVVHRTSVLRALKWTPKRLHDAEERLAARLAGTGTWLQRHHWGLAIWPASQYVTPDELTTLARHENARRTIDISQARLLTRLVTGKLDATWLSHASQAERTVLGELVNLGWAERGADGYQATRDVMPSFRPALDAIQRAEGAKS